MNEYPRDDVAWIESLPYYGTVSPDGRDVRCAGLFPGTPCSYREDIESGVVPTFAREPEEIFFNLTMGTNCAAFADIIGLHTREMYGLVRARAIFKILCVAWQSYLDKPYYFGTRAWMHGVCQEAMT